MENTTVNGTTITKDQEWKTKKGYGPIIVAVSLALLLGLSFYAGRHSSDAMRMTNGVASSSSSSLSLVSSGKYPIIRCRTDKDCPQPAPFAPNKTAFCDAKFEHICIYF